MKKIGIITLYRDNFGSILQAYATYSFTKSLGNDCVILQIKYSKDIWSKLRKVPILLYRCIRYKNYYHDWRLLRETSKKEINLLSSDTKKKMDNFIDSTFKIEECDVKCLEKVNLKYDYFITGSDQVWNGYEEFRYLVFADKEKRVALAPSFGTRGVKEYYKKDIIKALNGYEVLSVREESGVKIIKDLVGKEAIRLPDPTILLGKDEWIRFAEKGIKKNSYILLHFLNAPNKLAIEIINKYLKKNQCMVYCICNKYEIYERLLRYKFIDINPYDYVSLINNAEFIFTDSYHSTLFSLNLERQFFTFERQHFHNDSQSSRIVDLLHRVGMYDRFILKVEEDLNFDNLSKWDSDFIFAEERNNIKKYIMASLMGKE